MLHLILVCGLGLSAPAPPADVQPTRVLLFASAATREYQFVRNLLGREAARTHVKASVYLQLPPGRTEPREGVEQDATLLKHFPDKLAGYDVIVAFDPDWNQLSDDQQKVLGRWVDVGGGLIVVAGPVNTYQLARKADADKLKTVRDLYPVVPGDSRLQKPDDHPEAAFALHFRSRTKARRS